MPRVMILRVLLLVLLPATAQGAATLAVRVGVTSNYTDSTGQVWTPDNGCQGNQGTFSTTSAIAGALPAASDQPLYQNEKYGPMTCTYAVPNGSYNVLLKFSENYFVAVPPCSVASCVGQRIFNVSINGTAVLTNFDIVAAAGGPLKAIDKSFASTVSNGSLVIGFTVGSQNLPKINAIEISPATTASSMTIAGTVPGGGAGSVTLDPTQAITVNGTLGGGLTVIGTTPALTITATSPSNGANGSSFTIAGTGFVAGMTGFLTCPGGSTGTKFPMNLTFVSATQLNAVVPNVTLTLPVTCDVTVSTP